MHESPERTQAEWLALEAEIQHGWHEAWHHMADPDAHDLTRYGELFTVWQEDSDDDETPFTVWQEDSDDDETPFTVWQEDSDDDETPFTVWLDQYTPWDHG